MARRRGARARSSGEGEVLKALGRMSFKSGMVLAAALALIGITVSLLPPGAGWLALVPQTKVIFYSFAFITFVVASFGALRRWRDDQLFDSDVAIEQLSWEQFEGYLAAYYRSRGATVTYRGGATSDGGVDLVLDDANGRRIVQAKHWKVRSVGVVPLRALWGVREDERASGAVLVTSGHFTSDARAFAQGKALDLIDGPALRRLVREAKRLPVAAPETRPAPSSQCPRCNAGVLVERVARRGQHAGGTFLGCSRHPQCTFTRDIVSQASSNG